MLRGAFALTAALQDLLPARDGGKSRKRRRLIDVEGEYLVLYELRFAEQALLPCRRRRHGGVSLALADQGFENRLRSTGHDIGYTRKPGNVHAV